MAHRKLRKAGAVVASAAAMIGVGGGVIAIGAGAASAATTVSAITLYPAGAAPASAPQAATTPVPDYSFTISGAKAGDKIAIDIAPAGMTSNPIDATGARQVSWANLPIPPALATNTQVFDSQGPVSGALPPAPPFQTGPRFSLTAGHNPGDAPGVPATLLDELDLTVTQAATDSSTYTVWVGADPKVANEVNSQDNAGTPPTPVPAGTSTPLAVTTNSNTPLGALTTTATLTPAGGSASALTVASPATVTNGQVVSNVPSVAVPSSGASSFPISNVTYTETSAKQLAPGATAATPDTVTLTIDNPAPLAPPPPPTVAADGSACTTATPCSFTGTPSVAVTAGTAAGIGPATIVGGAVQFQVFSPSTLSPAVYTLSALKVAAAGAHPQGPILATLTITAGPDAGAIPGALGKFQIAGIAAPPAPIAGADRDGTAIAVLDQRWPHIAAAATPPAPNPTCVPNGAVVLARDDNYPDALSASYLASYLGTGILLTPSGSLSAETQNELKLQGVSTVYMVGGTSAISSSVETAIDNLKVYNCGGTAAAAANTDVATVRVSGADRYTTASAVALYPKSLPASNYIDLSNAVLHAKNYNNTSGAESSVPPGVAQNTAIIASGTNYPDAVAASTEAYGTGIPILLTDPNSLSASTSSTLQALGIKQVILMGGPQAVSDTVEGQLASSTGLGLTVIRVAGQDRTDTAQLLAHFAIDNLKNTFGAAFAYFSPAFTGVNTVYLARGDNFPDALTASSLTGAIATPLMLTADPNTLGTYLTTYLNSAGAAGATTANSIGGPLAVTPATLAAADAAIAAK